MKFFRYITISAFLVFGITSCKKENENQWNVDIKNPVKNIQITDLSGEFYDTSVSLEDFKKKYPWFQGSVPDSDYGNRRKDTMEENAWPPTYRSKHLQKCALAMPVMFMWKVY